MSAVGFWRQVGVGFALSLAAAVLFSAMRPWLGSEVLLRGLVLGLSGGYLALLLHALHARIGVVLTLASWLVLSGLLLVFNPTLWVWLALQSVLIWLLRCLYRYDRLGSAIADAALSGLALATAVVTASHTHSLFLTLWSWFLMQALFVFIPTGRVATSARAEPENDDAFGQAQRTAEAALRRLSLRF